MPSPPFGTFSIVACDPSDGTCGVAVHSKFISVGALVPWAEAKVGAVATQASSNPAWGPQGLALLKQGLGAKEVVRRLIEGDPGRESRQLGVVDARGEAAAFTGPNCMDWAGQVVGAGFACQGNILFGPAVVAAMARAYESTGGDIADRLLAALFAGQREGGDRRGQQSAALLVSKTAAGYGESDRWIDVRVDDHASPIEELRRIFRLYDLTLLNREDPRSLVPITGEVAVGVQHDLSILGYYTGRLNGKWDAPSQGAFLRFVGEHNFENKQKSPEAIWPTVLAYLKERSDVEVARRTRTAPIVSDALSKGPGAQPKGGEPSANRSKRSPASK